MRLSGHRLIQAVVEMKLHDFFQKHDINDYGSVDVYKLKPPAGFHPTDLLPSARQVVVFAKQIPAYAFELESKTKSFYLYNLIRRMDSIAGSLCETLIDKGFHSVPVPTFFPVRFKSGKIRGFLSLKHCAEEAGLGTIGENTLLISKHHGNRLCLAAVVTAKEFDGITFKDNAGLCLKCNKCREICPTRAIADGAVDLKKCINFTYSLPGVIKPLVLLMMKMTAADKYIEILVNIMGWNSDMMCSKCLTVCPFFHINTYRT
jgi:epoxyqueuosine reductase QueG